MAKEWFSEEIATAYCGVWIQHEWCEPEMEHYWWIAAANDDELYFSNRVPTEADVDAFVASMS